MKAAAFLDRDGTVIELVHHLTDPADVRLINGAGDAIARLNAAGVPVILVTNQSVIGRGKLTEAGLVAVHDAMSAQLEAFGAKVDAIYACPHAPKVTDPTVIEVHDRKPGPGMLHRAAQDHSLDIKRSFMVGDTVSDMLAGRNAGVAVNILVCTGYGDRFEHPKTSVDHEVADLTAAADIILKHIAIEDTP